MSSDIPFGDLPPLQGGDKIHMCTKQNGRRGTRFRELTVSRSADKRLPIQFGM